MTTFSFPVNIDNREPASGSVVDLTTARVPGRYSIPLFVAPAGSNFYECVLDITTAYDNLDTKITVGTSANPATLYAATTVNTAGRRAYAGTGAQVSTNSIALAADTTVQAIVSIATSTVAAGSVIVHVVIG